MSLWTKSSTGDATPKDTADVADTGLADVGLPSPAPDPPTSVPMARPQLQRHQPQPPPPHQPPPPPAPQQQQQQQMLGNPTDSLSLVQLKKLVTEFPKIDPTSYTFVYADTASFEEEIDEWFSYNEAEFKRLNRAKDTFGRRWKKVSEKSWLETDREQRLNFLKKEIEGMHAADLRRRCKSLQTILHVVLGIWDETAGKKEELDATLSKKPKNKTRATPSQIECMKENLLLLAESGGIEVVYDVMQNAFKYLW
jgi:hypothetical protein